MLSKTATKLENVENIAMMSITMSPPNLTLLNLSIYWQTGTMRSIEKRDLYWQDCVKMEGRRMPKNLLYYYSSYGYTKVRTYITINTITIHQNTDLALFNQKVQAKEWNIISI